MPTKDEYLTVAPGVVRKRATNDARLVNIIEMADIVSLAPRRLRALIRLLGVTTVRLGHRTYRYRPQEVIDALVAFGEAGGDIDAPLPRQGQAEERTGDRG